MHYRKSESINIESRIQVSLRLPHRCTHTCCQEYQIELSTKFETIILILLISSCSRKKMIFSLEWLYFQFSEFGKGDILTDCIFFFFLFLFFLFNRILFYQLPFQAQNINSPYCLPYFSFNGTSENFDGTKQRKKADRPQQHEPIIIITVTHGIMNEMNI